MPNNSLCACCHYGLMDCRICVWNASDGRLVHSLTGHSESTYVLDVHPFNPRIAMSSGYDGKTIIWDIWEGIPIRIYDIGRYKLVDGKFSPDGTSIVLSDDVGQICLLNTGQGEAQKDSKYDQFFLGDYRPLARDTHGNAIDLETQLPPYRRNIQDALCDSSMLPYPEPYQSNYQRRRLGALNLEWRPPTLKFAIGTDIGLGQEYQILPLADLDVVADPLPEFLDAMFWEPPENDVIVDTTDSEYNVTDECSTEEEEEDGQPSLSNSSADADSNRLDDGTHSHKTRSKRKKPKDLEWTTSSGRRVRKRNINEHEGTSSRISKRPKKTKNKSKRKEQVTPSRPQRAAARNGKKVSSQDEDDEDDVDDDVSEEDSSESETFIEDDEQEPPPESKKKLVLKFSLPKKSPAFEDTSLRLKEEEEEISRPPIGIVNGNGNGRKPPKIKIKQKANPGETSQMKPEASSQRIQTIKFKLNPHRDTQNANNTTDNHSFKLKAACDENDIRFTPNPLHVSGFGKTNWLLLTGQEEGCRYIPQLGDQVVYVRQGHQEYLEEAQQQQSSSSSSLEVGPWMVFKDKIIRDVEICSVHGITYGFFRGSGESCCKIKLRFTDPSSGLCGKTFKLTLPELVNFPDYLVERRRYEASLERKWGRGDKCSVWWRNAEGGGSWWDGEVVAMTDKSESFPGSPWERFVVEYAGDADNAPETNRHSHWELHHKDSSPFFSWGEQQQQQPGLHPEIRKIMLSFLSNLDQSARGNRDQFGIIKLKNATHRPDYINRYPVPLTLDIIGLRIRNMYYRSFEAMKHDITVMLSDATAYFANNAEMLAKMERLSDLFQTNLANLPTTTTATTTEDD